uniref:LIM zinc-binding domain-containing protein n=1 Tax=Periophthalmus magnuspinnatus TaxID=409849 RepID=A0A3B4A301_9GOBI
MDQSTCSLCVYSVLQKTVDLSIKNSQTDHRSLEIKGSIKTEGGGDLKCCGGHIQDRFFLLAAGRAWHSVCLCCSVCHCELQTQPSLFWRDGNPVSDDFPV